MIDNDELMAWLHEHAELIDDPFTKGRLRAAADEIDRLSTVVLCLLGRRLVCGTVGCDAPCGPRRAPAQIDGSADGAR